MTTYIAFGGNLGDVEGTIKKAYKLVEALPYTQIIKQSQIYVTPAWGGVATGDFLNGVWQVETTLGARELLKQLLAIETQLGREREAHWGNRTIDLDILLYGDEVIQTTDLVVPHPYMLQRAFVLEPLLDVYDGAKHEEYVAALKQLNLKEEGENE